MISNKYIEYLKAESRHIVNKAKNGCKISINILNYYKMYSSCPDGMTQVLLEGEIKDYENEYNRIHNEKL